MENNTLTLLNELEKTLDCMREQYPKQDFEIRMTNKTAEKLIICDLPTDIGDASWFTLSSYKGTDVIIVPDTYFPEGVDPDTVLISPKCNEPTVSFESGEML
jgi:hypothetical protein